ncbi:hypothetical protein [Flavobacterium sp. FlaQc-47]|uniref:hypothetical protein n=1 Tax=Flavobacterium sp. FlaQc-47 TaxID=3374180 RepID=UPI003757059D
MRNNKFLVCLISLQVLFSCTPTYTKKIDIQYQDFNIIDEKCKKEYGGSFTFDKIEISNYYYIEHKIGFNPARNTIDSIAIVVPKQFNMFRYDTNCNINDTDKNLLVITSSKSKEFFAYDKIISNESMLQGEELLLESKTGFIIQGDWGHSNKKFTNVYVNFYQNNFFIDSIRIQSDGKEQYNKIKTFKKSSFKLKNYTNKEINSLIELWSKK